MDKEIINMIYVCKFYVELDDTDTEKNWGSINGDFTAHAHTQAHTYILSPWLWIWAFIDLTKYNINLCTNMIY